MMLTAKEIAQRLASPADAGHGGRGVRVLSGPAEQGDEGRQYKAENDAMWETIVTKLNAEHAAKHAAEQLRFDRVRHWTREGLLSPAGDKNPGTGRARLYDESAVRKARALNSLTECGVTIRSLHVISDFLDNKADEWLTKTAGSSDLVYLVIQKFRWIEERDLQIRHLARGDNIPELRLGKTVEYAIVVDLTG